MAMELGPWASGGQGLGLIQAGTSPCRLPFQDGPLVPLASLFPLWAASLTPFLSNCSPEACLMSSDDGPWPQFILESWDLEGGREHWVLESCLWPAEMEGHIGKALQSRSSTFPGRSGPGTAHPCGVEGPVHREGLSHCSPAPSPPRTVTLASACTALLQHGQSQSFRSP